MAVLPFALGSFCTISHYPSAYNAVYTILDPRKWPHNDQKYTKTPKTAPKIFFPIFSFNSCIIELLTSCITETGPKISFPIFSFYNCILLCSGSFCTIPHYPSSYNTVDTVLDPSKMVPQRTKMDKNI